MAWGPAGEWMESETQLTEEEVEKLKTDQWVPLKKFLEDLRDGDSIYKWREGNNHRSRFGYRIKYAGYTVREITTGARMS